jgi:hypothetical protein
MRCCVARHPDGEELAMLQGLLDQQRARLASGEVDAAEILDSAADGDQEKSANNERAAWMLVARVLLNLDETITKE